MTPARWLRCQHALVGDDVVPDVWLGMEGDRLHHVGTRPHGVAAGEVEQVSGLVLPGLVDAHGHAFHRVLRGRTHGAGGSFWTWRDQMYDVAAALDPATLRPLVRAVHAELALAGVTTVGEFHYVHHPPGAAPDAMEQAVLAGADEAGVRVTLLDALYLTGRIGASVEDPGLGPVQQRFSDGTVDAWAARLERLVHATRGSARAHVGAALHSVRAVPPAQLADAVARSRDVLGAGRLPAGRRRVLHAHVAEQPAELADALAEHGRRPVALLAEAGALDESFTAVHGIWLDEADTSLLGRARATVCACPTTERDLADGVVAPDLLLDAGARLALGSDQHVAADLFEEARGLELQRRLVTRRRGNVAPRELLRAATSGGARSLGWHDTGRLRVDGLADLCVVGLDGPRLAGARTADLAAAAVFAATADDVRATMVGGRWIVRDGRHVDLDVAAELRTAIEAVDAAVDA